MPTGDTPPGPGLGLDTASDSGSCNLSSGRSRDQVSPHRLSVVLFIREYSNYKSSVMMTAKDKAAISLLILSLVQSPDVNLTNTCTRYGILSLDFQFNEYAMIIYHILIFITF